MAQPLEWGRNLGCDFVTKSCKYWIDSRRKAKKSISPFCDEAKKDLLETKCTSNREAVALCNLKKHEEDLPFEYQNFDYMFKILIIGNSSVGKTSFLFRYADDSFTSAFVSTVGIDFKVKTVFRQDKRVKLQIWVSRWSHLA